jgi:hypothetical protein
MHNTIDLAKQPAACGLHAQRFAMHVQTTVRGHSCEPVHVRRRRRSNALLEPVVIPETNSVRAVRFPSLSSVHAWPLIAVDPTTFVKVGQTLRAVARVCGHETIRKCDCRDETGGRIAVTSRDVCDEARGRPRAAASSGRRNASELAGGLLRHRQSDHPLGVHPEMPVHERDIESSLRLTPPSPEPGGGGRRGVA